MKGVSMARAYAPALTRAPGEAVLGSKHNMYLLLVLSRYATSETTSNDRPFTRFLIV